MKVLEGQKVRLERERVVLAGHPKPDKWIEEDLVFPNARGRALSWAKRHPVGPARWTRAP